MGKYKELKSEKQNSRKRVERISLSEIPLIIAEKKAFQSLQYQHRRKLYEKVNSFFQPKKTTGAIKNWFLYPELKINPKHAKFVIPIMTECLAETLNDELDELNITRAKLDELINQFSKYIERHEQTIR